MDDGHNGDGRHGKINVFICEDKDVMRAGLRQVVSAIERCHVIGDASNFDEAWMRISETNPTVCLVKQQFPGGDGVELALRIKRDFPKMGVIMMLGAPEEFWTAINAKADAYFFREVPVNILEPALHAVAAGETYLGQYVLNYLLRGDGYNILKLAASRRTDNTELGNLSKREHEVLGLLSEGKSNEQIARDLGLSIQTVKVHVKHILKKLKVTDRTQAVIKALKA